MSQIEDDIYELLVKALPFYKIERQYYVNIDGQKVFFDFRIENLNLLIEVHGAQHYTQSKFYHGTERQFRGANYRDFLKKEWARSNGYVLIEIPYNNLPTSVSEVIDLITK